MNKKELLNLIKNNQIVFEDVPENFLDDKDVSIALLKNNLNIFGFLSENMRDDRDVAKLSISLKNENILYIGKNLRKNIEFHEELLNDGKLFLGHVSKEMRSSKVFMKKATVIGANFKYMSEDLWKDEDFIKSLIIDNYGRSILLKDSEYDNIHLRDNEKLWLDLLEDDIGVVQLLSENVTTRLRENKKFILEVLRPDGLMFFYHIAERLKTDKEILMKFAKCQTSSYLGMLPDEICKDTDFLMEILSQYEQDNKLKFDVTQVRLETFVKLLKNDEFKNIAKKIMLSDNDNNKGDVNNHVDLLKYVRRFDNILQILLNEMRNKKEKEIITSLMENTEFKKTRKIKF